MKLEFVPARRMGFRITLCSLAAILVIIDLADTYQSRHHTEAVPVSQLKYDGVPSDYQTKIAFVRSDDRALSSPAPLNQELEGEQIHEMVARALDLSGELKPLLFEGARITLKPNVVDISKQGEGVVTDSRVVEGIILWMENLGIPNLKYTVAEGGAGWLAPEMQNTPYNTGMAPIADGFEIRGYRAMIDRLESRGNHTDLIDADFGSYDDPLSNIHEVPVPDFIDFPVSIRID